MAYDLTDQEIDRVIRALDAAPHGSKGAVLKEWAQRLSPDPDDPMSKQTLRRHIRNRYGKAKEAPGRPKEIPEAVVDFVENVKARGMEMGTEDRELSTEQALEMAERKGIEGAADASPSAVNRRLREERGFREKKRYRKVEADFATQRQLLDFSRSEHLQVRDYDEDKDDWLLEVSENQLSYKDPEGAFRTWYALLIDDHSRVKVGRLFCNTGEDALLGLTFLRWAWTREEDDNPLCHVPRILQTDHGAFYRSNRVKNAFDSLEEVELKGASKESQGKIERSFRTLWQRFETHFVIENKDGYQIHLSDFNHLLHEHLTEEARRQHPEKPHSCKHVYEGSIARTPPLQTEADMVKLAFDTDTRKVDPYGRISIDGEKYRCPDSIEGIAIEPGMHVRYYHNAEGRVIGRLVERNHQEAFDLEPWTQPAFEEHGGEENTGTGRTRLEQLRRQVDVTSSLREDVLEEDAPEVEVDEDGILANLGDRHIDVTVDSDFHDDGEEEAYPMPVGQAREHIGRRLGAIGHTYADAAHVFDPLVGDATKAELDKVIKSYLKKHDPTESTAR
jgi:hypothetical protein